MTDKSNSFIENKTQLIQYFNYGIKKDTDLRIGVEHEKFLFNKTDFKRINYDQIEKIFEILKEKGWSDVVLVERKELTSGSTWHAAGLLPLFNMSYSVG